MNLIVCIQNSHLTNKDFVHLLASCNYVSLCSFSGAQPALHFGGGNFHEISFDDVIVLIQPWQNFFASRHRYSSLRSISENENFSVLIKQTWTTRIFLAFLN